MKKVMCVLSGLWLYGLAACAPAVTPTTPDSSLSTTGTRAFIETLAYLAGSAPAPTLALSATPMPTLTASPAPTSTPNWQETVSAIFDTTNTEPPQVEELNVEQRGNMQVYDITYTGAKNARVSAYLVVPPGSGPFAGVVFLHWLEVPSGSRAEFLDEALTLAAQGVISILPQGDFPWKRAPRNAQADTTAITQQTLSFRRAIDVLLSRPDVDPQRLAVVGHDFGAMYASLLADTDSRPKAYILMAGTPRFADWFLTYWPIARDNETRQAYRAALTPYNPIEHIRYAAPAMLFFQFANNDVYIDHAAAQSFFEAASEPKHIEWYEAEHGLNEQARADRLTWLSEQLNLKP